ncbi:19402_t:CDS:2 [Gigaspora margarita]|uniref:19402_t:CDS:1 n=1 Tax=Gigaspora margarita TaxID=4874 RepID=A0ABN7VD80_GIGMA|nr:19402_t:CDS:2 [Gigaspora margarita]
MYLRVKAGVDYVVDTYRTMTNTYDARVDRDNSCSFTNGVLEVNPELVDTPIGTEVVTPISRIFVIYRPTEDEARLINQKLDEIYSLAT